MNWLRCGMQNMRMIRWISNTIVVKGVITILNLTQRRKVRKELKINKNSAMFAVRLSESASGTTLREKY